MPDLTTRCCIAGGGPAGMMLGFLLARAGHQVSVLEKHKDFFRDFRGDTIHPSTLELLYELGILDDFLAIPHNQNFEIEDLLTGVHYTWHDRSNYVALRPDIMPAHVFRLIRPPNGETTLNAAVTEPEAK